LEEEILRGKLDRELDAWLRRASCARSPDAADHPADVKAAEEAARQCLIHRRALRAELAEVDAELAELMSRRSSILDRLT
jgi:hypothetical protein